MERPTFAPPIRPAGLGGLSGSEERADRKAGLGMGQANGRGEGGASCHACSWEGQTRLVYSSGGRVRHPAHQRSAAASPRLAQAS